MVAHRSILGWVLGGLCLGLSVSVVALFEYNVGRQNLLQVRQQELNQGFLGPETQQITGQVLEDLATASHKHVSIRRILRLYGYTVPPLSGAQQIAGGNDSETDEAAEEAVRTDAGPEAMPAD